MSESETDTLREIASRYEPGQVWRGGKANRIREIVDITLVSVIYLEYGVRHRTTTEAFHKWASEMEAAK